MKLRRKLEGKSQLNKSTLVKTILFTSVVFFISISQLVKKSQFVDSLIYSGIAKDFAKGKSSFWNYYDVSYAQSASGHPPFAMYLQSFFFKIFNSEILPHALFTMFNLSLNILGIFLIWSMLFPQKKDKVFVPIFLWFLTPLIFWSFSNNILENTLSYLILFSTYFCIRSVKQNNFYFTILGALFSILAVLTKGPVGLFPLIVLPLYWVIYKNKKAFYYSISFTIASISTFFLILLHDDAYIFFKDYIEIQLFPSLNGDLENNKWTHFYITQKLLVELIPLFIVFLIFYFKKQIDFKQKKEFLFLLLLGIFCSLPLSISPKAHGFYLVPSIAFFALAFSSLFNFNSLKLNTFLSKSYVLAIVFMIFSASLFVTFLNYGKIDKNKEKIEFTSEVRKLIPSEIKQVYLAPNLELDFYLRAFFTRYNDIRTETDKSLNYHVISSQDINSSNTVLVKTQNFALVKNESL